MGTIPPDTAAVWRQALEDFRHWFNASQAWRNAVGTFGCALIGVPTVVQSPRYLPYFLALLALVIAVPYAIQWWQRAHPADDSLKRLPEYQRRRLEQLEHADLAARLVAGEITGNEPAPHVPAALRWLVPQLWPDERVRILRRVLFWEDWYLGPPRRAISVYWTMLAGFAGMPLMWVYIAVLSGEYWNICTGLGFGLMFIGFVDSKYSFEARALVRYLQTAWEPAQPADSEAMPAAAAPASSADLRLTRQTVLIINQAEQDLERSNRLSAMLPVTLALFGALPLMLTQPEQFMLVLIPACLPFLMALENSSLLAGYRRRIAERLAASSLAARLAAGDCSLREHTAHVAPLWRPLARFPRPLKAYADELRGQLWTAAFNLDWYLERPRPLFRWHWPALAGQALVLLAGYGYAALGFTPSALLQPAFPSAAAIIYLCVLTALGLPTVSYALRAAVWISELARYLRSSAEE